MRSSSHISNGTSSQFCMLAYYKQIFISLRKFVVVIVWQLDLQLPMQSVPITTEVVTSNPAHVEVYSIQHYVIKFVSALRRVNGAVDRGFKSKNYKMEFVVYLRTVVSVSQHNKNPQRVGLVQSRPRHHLTENYIVLVNNSLTAVWSDHV